MKIAITAFLILLAAATVANAQSQCLASLNVSPSRSVTVLNFGVHPGEGITVSMPCTAAELMRERMFISGQALSITAFNDIAALRMKLVGVNAGLQEQKAALVAAGTKAKRSVALDLLAGLGGAVGVSGSAVGCLERKGASCVKVMLAVAAIYKAVDSAATSAGDLKKEADAAVAEIDTLTAAQIELLQRISAAQAAQYKSRYNAAFAELCSSIQRQCLR